MVGGVRGRTLMWEFKSW